MSKLYSPKFLKNGKMKNITRKINIKFLFFNDKVCGRCKTTDDFLDEALKKFKQKNTDLKIIVKREKLRKEDIKRSPTILLDNTDLESYLPQNFAKKSDNCQDCSCLIGQPVSCRIYGNNENLSKEQILEALDKHLKI